MKSFFFFPKIIFTVLFGAALFWPAVSQAYCGDGALQPPQEECDDGNYLNRDGCSDYCKIEDMTPPTVASVSIPNQTQGVDTLTDTITLVFSEPMNSKTFNSYNVVLEYMAKPLDISFALAEDQKTLTITVKQELFSEGVHALKIKNVYDAAGNAIKGEYDGVFISTFTTAKAIDHTAPTVVADPPEGTYTFPQNVTLTPYLGSYTGSEEFIDATAKIYYTLDDVNLSDKSPVYKLPLSIREGTTLRYFAVDAVGNKTPAFALRYRFACPEFPNAKTTLNHYPECKILDCEYGYVLTGGICVSQLGGGDPNDYRLNAVTAPLFPSPTPMTITTKPAIYVTKEHKGVIPRPVIFKDLKRGTRIEFEQNTKITTPEGKPFTGYLKQPDNLYIKNFPINFGYSFKSIFQFKDAEGHDLDFSPAIKITLPYGEGFDYNETAIVFTYDPATERYREYNRGLYEVNMFKKEVSIKSYKTGAFFIAQKGKNYNRSVFKDVTDHWAKNYIETLYRKGIVAGRDKGIFAPNEFITRAEFIKIVLKALGGEVKNLEESDPAPFKDVPLYAWHVAFIKKAKELGLISGYPDKTFKPDQFINRAEAIKILFSAFKIDVTGETAATDKKNDKKTDIVKKDLSKIRFADLGKKQWYYPYALFALEYGLLESKPKPSNPLIHTFGPGEFLTRAEMAKLTVKTMEWAGR